MYSTNDVWFHSSPAAATAPQNLRVATGPDSVGQRHILLQWDLPIMPNGIIAQYRVGLL